MSSISTKSYSWRVTGKQSVERMQPLILKKVESLLHYAQSDDSRLGNNNVSCCYLASTECTEDYQIRQIVGSNEVNTLDFVWETFCEQDWKPKHDSAVILNRLHNSVIIESKANFAILQIKAKEIAERFPVFTRPKYLDTFIALNANQVLEWCQKKWPDNDLSNSDQWWVLKAGKGNGGRDIWMLTRDCYEAVVLEISTSSSRKSEEYVIQRYVDRPKLWQGKKYHYRCYGLVKADMTTYLYSMAFILTAGLKYVSDEGRSDSSCPDPHRHITNLSINKRIEGHPGQIPINVALEQPEVFRGMSDVWSTTIEAASNFMQYQKSSRHFEFFGLDIIVDEFGICWLIEANRLPGLESSKINTLAEDDMYNKMMESVLDITMFSTSNTKEDLKLGLWKRVKDASFDERSLHPDSPTWKNLFSWKAFTRKNRGEVIVSEIKEIA